MANNIRSDNPASFSDLWLGFRQLIENYIKENLSTVRPVEVVAVNGVYINVKPLLQNKNTSGNILPITDDDIIYNVPVLMMVGGNSSLTFNIGVGNQGLLIACKNDISNYKKNKTTAPIASRRTFSWTDGFYLPMIFQDMSEGINFKQGSSFIQILDGKIKMKADVNIEGSLTVSDIITGKDCLTASGISLEKHTHEYADTQPNGQQVQKNTQPPQ